MIDFWGEKDFKTLYNEFVRNSSSGKIFMMRDYENEDTFIGRGATILLRKASVFILGILKELYIKDSSYIIGDIDLLFELVEQYKKKMLKKLNIQKARNLAKAPERKIQLHSILRKQKSLKPLNMKLELKKKGK